MTIFEIDPLQDRRWNVFTDAHPDASVFHGVEWLQALKTCYGYESRVATSTPPGYPLTNGLVFCQVRSRLTGNRLVSIPFSDHCEPLVDHEEVVDLFLDHLIAEVDADRWQYVEIRPVLRGPLFRKALGVGNSYYVHRLDLRRPEESIYKSFHKDSVQRKIQRAERERLRYEEGRSEDLLDHFYKLLIMTRRRQGLPPQPRKWFSSLITCLGDDLKVRVAFMGDTAVASILTISNKKTMVYKYGCSDTRFNNLGGTALLFWRAIQEAKAAGIEELDMGRSDTDNVGLVNFKERWGAKRTTINYWRYTAQSAPLKLEAASKRVKWLVSHAPDAALIVLGNLLYRHIG